MAPLAESGPGQEKLKTQPNRSGPDSSAQVRGKAYNVTSEQETGCHDPSGPGKGHTENHITSSVMKDVTTRLGRLGPVNDSDLFTICVQNGPVIALFTVIVNLHCGKPRKNQSWVINPRGVINPPGING